MLLRAQNYEQKRVWVTLLEFGRQGSRELHSNGSESSAVRFIVKCSSDQILIVPDIVELCQKYSAV